VRRRCGFDYVSLTLEEYTSVRRMGPAYFIPMTGHRELDIERVVGGEVDRC
jgi:hypothetical protein